MRPRFSFVESATYVYRVEPCRTRRHDTDLISWLPARQATAAIFHSSNTRSPHDRNDIAARSGLHDRAAFLLAPSRLPAVSFGSLISPQFGLQAVRPYAQQWRIVARLPLATLWRI